MQIPEKPPAPREDAGENLQQAIERAREAQRRRLTPQIRPAKRNPRHFADPDPADGE